MEVAEVMRLANWVKQHTAQVEPLYVALVSVLQNNAQQSAQLPVSEPLEDLSKALSEMPTQEISALQMRVLEDLGCAELVGKRGKQWLNRTIRGTTYDPATTFQAIKNAATTIAETKRRLLEFNEVAKNIGLAGDAENNGMSEYLVNVIFQGEASIKNVRDWKKTATDWELIISGVAGLVGEKAEEVRVLGTANGSIIFTLSASSLITKILATISKHIAGIGNDYHDFQLKREDLSRSRMLTKVMQDELLRIEEERRSAGKISIIDAVKKLVPDAKPEDLSKLDKAIATHITFNERGGEVDFVTPHNIDEKDHDLAIDLADIRQLIEDYRSEKQKTKLLTDNRKSEDNEA